MWSWTRLSRQWDRSLIYQLLHLPSMLRSWILQLQQHAALLQEYNDLLRELILFLSEEQAKTGRVADVPASVLQAPLAPPPAADDEWTQLGDPGVPISIRTTSGVKDPKRIRTAADVSFSSQLASHSDDRADVPGNR